MKLTKEMLEKAKTAKSAEELYELAKAQGVELSAQEAADAFAELHKSGELADEELDNVTGGGCSKVNRSETGEKSRREDVVPLYKVGQKVEYCNTEYSTISGVILEVKVVKWSSRDIYYPAYKIKLKHDVIEENVAQENIQIP